MNRVLLMTVLVLSIVVLATGSILPSVDAMKPTVDPSTGIKIQCRITHDDRISCKVTSKDKLDIVTIVTPDGGGVSNPIECERSITVDPQTFVDGDTTVTATKCGGGQISVFSVTVENKKVTNVAVIP